jgi:3-oxoacyl-[acyl-carrier protein] reductase
MRNVIVTGGNRGLGLGITRKLAGPEYRVIAVGRKQTAELEAAMQEAHQRQPGSLHFVRFDLARTEKIAALVKSLRKQHGPVYGLVNNAGISFDNPLSRMSNAQIERLIRVNTISPIVLTKYVVRAMMADGGGRIVNIASILAFTGYTGLSVYGSTKASLVGFTRSLAREVGRMGVNVNAVAPGFVDTDMTKSLTEEQRKSIMRRSALKRLAEVEDVAHAVEFLLGPQSKSITGTVLTVDAGSIA